MHRGMYNMRASTGFSLAIEQTQRLQQFLFIGRPSFFQVSYTMPKRQRSADRDSNSNESRSVLRHPSIKKAREIDAKTPYEELVSRNTKSKSKKVTKGNVLHWFRSKDIRAEDNTALVKASILRDENNQESGLYTCYFNSPKELQWQGCGTARNGLMFHSLQKLQDQLHGLNIPLIYRTVDEPDEQIETILQLAKDHDITHIYANFEYEVDELRRDLSLFKRLEDDKEMETPISFTLFHDQTIVEPATLLTGNETPHKVFTPYHRAWVSEIQRNAELLDSYKVPTANKHWPNNLKNEVESVPVNDRKGMEELWPAGNGAARDRLKHFLENKVKNYDKDRSDPSKDMTSRLSPYFAMGILSAREAVSQAKKANDGIWVGSPKSNGGIASWVRELAFRDFYRHLMVITPHNSMNLPNNLNFNGVEWEDDEEGWEKWCEGTTGVPFVDAGMRQLNSEAYMHNRLRMNVSSYLRANLLIDYRRGERYFAENLVDWDLCNNTQGWEPSYTVFNPVIQAEKNDPNGDYIRKWVPELKDVSGRAVFDPYNRLSKKEFEKLDYPQPHVEFSETKERCIERYKKGIAHAKELYNNNN